MATQDPTQENTPDGNGHGDDSEAILDALLMYVAVMNEPGIHARLQALESALKPWLERYSTDSVLGLVRMIALRQRSLRRD